jgi:hypothetical protein
MSQYPASGVLFANDRKQNDKQPDYTGNLEIDVETVRDLYQQMQSGGDHPKVNLAGWAQDIQERQDIPVGQGQRPA